MSLVSKEKLAFICFYGQIRQPQNVFKSLIELRKRLENENYTIKIFAHLWFDYDERYYDTYRKLNIKCNKEDLDFFISTFKPVKITIENSKSFRVSCEETHKIFNVLGTSSNSLSQMNSRSKLCNLVEEYCKDYDITEPEFKNIPVFTTRLEYPREINPNLIDDFKKNPSSILISKNPFHCPHFNDNFMCMNAFNYLSLFKDIDKKFEIYIKENRKIKYYNLWNPENVIIERMIDLELELERTRNIPLFF